ncbi:PPE family protein, SVP subgroup, partial [Mycobacterium sp.]|uniref:PPE family protein, SVP subgroup n=1 Tax=Mycobacterium sp. TaxID=1785 RepID=UPI003C75169D
PPSWTAPSTAPHSALSGSTPFAAPRATDAAGMAGTPGMAGAAPGGPGARLAANPRYGVRLTVMARHPAVG